jgi:predicted nucleotidyltransferase
MKVANIELPIQQIEAFCRKYKMKELSLFGSVLRDDFRPDSDVDVLLAFQPEGGMTFENFLDIRDELSAMFRGREVDVVQKRLLKNPFRRYEILTTREVVYAA